MRRSSSKRVEWLLPLDVRIHETMKVTSLSSSFNPPREKFLRKILETTFVKLDFVEIFHYSKVSPIDCQFRRLQSGHSRPYLTCDNHIYTFDMRNK